MYGLNPILPPVLADGRTLGVKEIFPTLQGEGPYAGWPAVFVRLGGCNLACDFCDTEFDDPLEFDLNEIAERVEQFAHVHGRKTAELVVITGGEPLRQPIGPLCEKLMELDYLVQIETNGTLFRKLPYGVDVICSPKATNDRYHPVRGDLLERISAMKFVVSASRAAYCDVPELGQASRHIPVYVQPMDEYDEVKNRENLSRCLQLVTEYGYRLSLQQHKLLNIP